MKLTFLAIVVLCILPPSLYGAIEFNEAGVQGLVRSSIVLASDFGESATSTDRAEIVANDLVMVAEQSQAAVVSAMSSGSAGSTGTVSGTRGGQVSASMNGGGGGGGRNGDAEKPHASDDLLDDQPLDVDKASPDNEMAPADPRVVSMPEPSTAVVWLVLAACGVFAIRRKQV